MLLFTPSSRDQIRTTISNRTDKSSTSSKHFLSSNLDERTETTTKNSSLSLYSFDSILSCSVTKPLTTNSKKEKSPTRPFSSSCPQSSFVSNIQLPEQSCCFYNSNAINEDELCVRHDEHDQLLNKKQDNH